MSAPQAGDWIDVVHDYFTGLSCETATLRLQVSAIMRIATGGVYGHGVREAGCGFDFYVDTDGAFRHGRRLVK